jgi:hypothetical protein
MQVSLSDEAAARATEAMQNGCGLCGNKQVEVLTWLPAQRPPSPTPSVPWQHFVALCRECLRLRDLGERVHAAVARAAQEQAGILTAANGCGEL